MSRRSLVAIAVGVGAVAVAAVGINALHDGSSSCSETRALSCSDFALATRIARQDQARVKGTFVGAVASRELLTRADQRDTGCPTRHVLTVRVVWKADANFQHSGGFGAFPPDGPLKGTLTYVDPTTKHICAQGATFRSVGARTDEGLLYGDRPVDPTGKFGRTPRR